MCSSAVTVKTKITIRAHCALESVSLNRFHSTFNACDVLVHECLQLQLSLQFLNKFELFSDIISEYLFICSKHFNFSCQRCNTIVIPYFTLLQYFLASFLANFCFILTYISVILHESPSSHEIASLVGTHQRIVNAELLMLSQFAHFKQLFTAFFPVLALYCQVIHHVPIPNYQMRDVNYLTIRWTFSTLR